MTTFLPLTATFQRNGMHYFAARIGTNEYISVGYANDRPRNIIMSIEYNTYMVKYTGSEDCMLPSLVPLDVFKNRTPTDTDYLHSNIHIGDMNGFEYMVITTLDGTKYICKNNIITALSTSTKLISMIGNVRFEDDKFYIRFKFIPDNELIFERMAMDLPVPKPSPVTSHEGKAFITYNGLTYSHAIDTMDDRDLELMDIYTAVTNWSFKETEHDYVTSEYEINGKKIKGPTFWHEYTTHTPPEHEGYILYEFANDKVILGTNEFTLQGDTLTIKMGDTSQGFNRRVSVVKYNEKNCLKISAN